jgi:predicted ATPase
MPILEALGRLCREPDGEQVVAILGRHAPTWLVQMPALLEAVELEALQRKTAGATRERMLREMGEAIDVITAARPLVLWLEDLHWSDASTLELLAFVARRSPPARLLLLGTYRPVEMLSASHPLKQVTQELYAHHLGTELVQRRLTTNEIHTYLTLRFPESVLPTRLGEVLHHRTEGNPLFLTTMVQEMVQHGVLSQTANGLWTLQGEVTELKEWMPGSVRYLLARQRERLMSKEQWVLEAASLAGVEFSAATVAAALETEIVQVEEHCGRLAEQQQFLRLAGISEWPDGTRAARYGFLHALYQECWHERVSVSKQQRWHLQMGERKEAAYGQRAGEIAAELALHFEQGRNYRKAVQYLQQAGENAVRRSAYQEAIVLLTKGLELLQIFPDTRERTQQELTLQLALNSALILVKGFTAPEVEKAATRSRQLCQQLGETPQLFPVLGRLYMFHQNRGELQTTCELAEQMIRLAQSAQDRGLLSLAHTALGGTLYWLGELTSAQPHLEQAIALCGHLQHPRHTAAIADPRVHCLYYASVTLWHLGYPDKALKRSQEAVVVAAGSSHPFSLAQALGFAALFHSFRREWQIAQERAEAVIVLSTEQGFPFWLAQGTIVRGRALTEQGQVEEGLAQMRRGLAVFRDMGAELVRTALLHLLAATYAKVGRTEEGLRVVAEALAFVDKTGERFSEAELYRIKGELTFAQSSVQGLESGVQENQKAKGKDQKVKNTDPRSLPPDPQGEAEAYFLKAIDIARKQQAKSLELRATMSLARLWQQQGKHHQAHKILSEVYNWFTEGFDTKDLQEAKALLEALS